MADFELQPVNNKNKENLQVGDSVIILTDEGHTPEVSKDMIAKIAMITPTVPYYDVMVKDQFYHRWLDESEILPQDFQ